MILPLRQRHRRMFAVLGVVLPVAFALGIAARRPVTSMTSTPPGLADFPRRFLAAEWDGADLFEKAPVRVRLLREAAGQGNYAVELSARKDFVKPDLIVYWVAGNPEIAGAVPANSVLLGGFYSGAALPLPAGAASTGGVLVLYSLAESEIVDVSKPLPF